MGKYLDAVSSMLHRDGRRSTGSATRGAVYFVFALTVLLVVVYVAKFFYGDQTFGINANTEVVRVELGGPQEFFTWYVGDARLFLFHDAGDGSETVESDRVCRALIKVPNGYWVQFVRIGWGDLDITLKKPDAKQPARLYHLPNDSPGENNCRCPNALTIAEKSNATYEECELTDYATVRIEDTAALSRQGQTRVFPIKGDIVIGNEVALLAIPEEMMHQADAEINSGALVADIQQVPGQPILRSGTVTIRGESIFSGNFFEARRVALDPGDSVEPVTEKDVFSAGFVAIADCEGCLGLRAVVNALGEKVTVRHWGAKGYDLSVKHWDGYTKDPVAQVLWISFLTIASLLWIVFDVLKRVRSPSVEGETQDEEKEQSGI